MTEFTHTFDGDNNTDPSPAFSCDGPFRIATIMGDAAAVTLEEFIGGQWIEVFRNADDNAISDASVSIYLDFRGGGIYRFSCGTFVADDVIVVAKGHTVQASPANDA